MPLNRAGLLLFIAALASGPALADCAGEAGIAAHVADRRAGRPSRVRFDRGSGRSAPDGRSREG